MKKEARVLEYIVRNDFFVGIIKRSGVIEHVIIESLDKDLPRRLLERTELKEVRKIFVLGRKPGGIVTNIIGGEVIDYSTTTSFHEKIINELIRITEKVRKN